MASPPYNPSETVPQDSDVVAVFPAAERTFRDIVESWLNAISNTYGYVEVPSVTSTERDTETNWTVGNMVFNETLNTFQVTKSIDPDVWTTIGFEAGTRIAGFQQTAAPLGWTKVTDSAYHNVALRLSTGTVSSGGTNDFSDALVATVQTGTVGGTTLTESQIPAHTHNLGSTYNFCTAPFSATGMIDDNGAQRGMTPGTSITTSSTGGGTSHDHSFTGSAIGVKYRDVTLAQRDAYS